MYLYNIQSEVRDGVVTMATNRNETIEKKIKGKQELKE
jgi:hypothetical protein